MLKEKMIRYKVMERHMLLVKTGEFGAAHILLRLLRVGTVRLGLDDDANTVERYLESIGLSPRYTRNYYAAVFCMPAENKENAHENHY